MNWSKINDLVLIYGARHVARHFDAWAYENKGASGNPLILFAEVAEGLIKGEEIMVPSNTPVADLKDQFITGVQAVSGSTVAFNPKQLAQLMPLIAAHGADVVSSAYRLFMQNVRTEKDLQYAAKNFADIADQFIKCEHDSAKKQAQVAALLETAKAQLAETREPAVEEEEQLDPMFDS